MSRLLSHTARLLNDVGLAAWFAGAVHPGRLTDPRVRGATQAAAGLHVLGATYLTYDNRGRIAGQRGVATVAGIKGALTIAALLAHVLGELLRVRRGAGAARPAQGAEAGLTGAILVANSALGEQQRPREVLRGIASRLRHQ